MYVYGSDVPGGDSGGPGVALVVGVVLVVLVEVLVVSLVVEVEGKFLFELDCRMFRMTVLVWDNCYGYAYDGTLKGSYQHTPGATWTSLRLLAKLQ